MAARDLAEFHGVSESYLVKHLKSLSAAGILESVPGPKGGFRFAKDPRKVTLLHVVEGIEGKLSAFRCMEIRQNAPVDSPPDAFRLPCALHVAMLRAERAYRDSLNAQTVQDVVDLLGEKLDADRQSQTADWVGMRVRSQGNVGSG
jgi:Rrf2 family protein